MRVSLLIVAMTLALAGAPQDKPAPEKYDPFANPLEEMAKRAQKAAQQKKYTELKDAAAELADLSRKMSDEIDAGGKDVISAKIFQQIDRAEKLLKTIRDKAK